MKILRLLNGTKGDAGLLRPAAFAPFASRPIVWRIGATAGEEVNYRRFFGLNDLVALREEDSERFI